MAAVGGRRAAAVLLVFLLAMLVEWTGARGDDWIPRTLDPLLHGGAPSHRPARVSRPRDRQQATPTTTVPASPAGEPSALGAAPSAEPARSTEIAEPTSAEVSGDGQPSSQPLAWKLAGFAAIALAVAALPFGIRLRRRGVFAFAPATADPIEAARALLASGQADLALARLDEALAGGALERASADALALYAGLLGNVGRVADALAALDAARRREPALPHLATQIEELRKQGEDGASTAARTGAPSWAADRYEILEEVGRGGMAVVYRARDTRLGRIVALKRIADNLREHPQAVDMLLREARNAARLNHPHIVTVYDVDRDGDSYFITMEFLEGKALLGVLQRRGRFAPKRVVWLAKQVATGLAYAHDRGVVHRDIKAANLFFVVSSQTLKIMDFGLARIFEEVRRRTTVIAGTPSYMSPEQAQGLAVDGRADLYAFGITLFELLTGTLPFQEGDLAEQHRNAPIPDPRERAAGIPDALAELVLHLLAKRPDDRPASAGEVAAKLRQIEGALD